MATLRRLAILLFFLPSITYSQDTTCGIVWYPPIQISPGIPGVSESAPSLAVQGNTVHITWAFSSQKCPYSRSTNGGVSFEPVVALESDTSTGITAWSTIVSTPRRVSVFYIRIPQDEAWMRQSTDGGTTWSAPAMVTDSMAILYFASALDDTILLLTARFGDYARIYRSTNGGNTWIRTLPAIVGSDPTIAMTPGAVHMFTHWVFDSAGVWSEYVAQYRKSTNLGDTWSDSVNLSSMSSIAAEGAIAADGTGDSATVFSAWRDVKYGCVNGAACSILGRYSQNTGGSFLEETRFDSSHAGYRPVVAAHRNTLVVAWTNDPDASTGSPIRVSLNRGLTWCPEHWVVDTTNGGTVTGLAVTETSIHVAWYEWISGTPGSYRVFYRRGVFLPNGISVVGNYFPSATKLAQNYPNPFNPRTTVTYEIRSRSVVRLAVYDILGRVVTTLAEGIAEPGIHEAVWDGSGHSSGVYCYRLLVEPTTSAGITIVSRKMILLR